MKCGSCGGEHVGKCPGVGRKCRECGKSFTAGNGWPNHFLCSFKCCDAVRAKLAAPPPTIEEDFI